MRASLLMFALGLALSMPAAARPLDLAQLAARIDAIQTAVAPATLGVGVRDLESGRQLLLHGESAFPLQSVFKLPLAIAALARVDRGELALDAPIRLGPSDRRGGWSPLAARIPDHGLQLPLHELLRQSVEISDNSAADAVISLLGGMAAVRDTLGELGIHGIQLNRSEYELIPGAIGLAPSPEYVEYGPLQREIDALADAELTARIDAHLADRRDTATPLALLDLLQALDGGKLLSKASSERLQSWLLASNTGRDRLRAGLPATWKLAHKTGSSATYRGRTPSSNDVGIVYGPNGERIAIVVLLKDAYADQAGRDRAIADVARAVVASLH